VEHSDRSHEIDSSRFVAARCDHYGTSPDSLGAGEIYFFTLPQGGLSSVCDSAFARSLRSAFLPSLGEGR
jgi:hypothetical protein